MRVPARVTVGRDVRCCLAISVSPEPVLPEGYATQSYDDGPDTSGLDILTRTQALQFVRDLEKDGLLHSIWTFGTPFIGGICNCDRSDCVAMRTRVKHGVRIMFKAEYVAAVDRDLCTGCRECLRLCQFGAMGFSWSDRKAYIDALSCFGCGVCRAACARGAISLLDRTLVPLVAKDW